MYQGFNVDITVLDIMQTRLRRAERLATLGQVAAGIAHEIRNPLVGIGSTTSLLLDDTDPSDGRRPTSKSFCRRRNVSTVSSIKSSTTPVPAKSWRSPSIWHSSCRKSPRYWMNSLCSKQSTIRLAVAGRPLLPSKPIAINSSRSCSM